MKLANFFIENSKFTWVLMVGLLIYGLSGLMTLNSESFPTVDMGSVVITTVYPGASAVDIETKITKPLEDEIRSVRGLKEVKSVSQAGVSRIVTVVDIDKYDVKEVISDLQRAVDRTPDLPTDLETPPDFLEMKSEEFPVLEVAITGANENRLRDRVAYELREELEDNKKIASIIMTGYRERQFNIYVHQNKLRAFHVGLNEVGNKVRSQNLNIPGGSLESGDGELVLRVEGKMKSVEELENLVIRSNFSGERVLLKDVATVQDSMEDARDLALYEGEPATLITIAKKGGADIIELSNEVKAEIKNFEEKYGESLKFQIFNDEGRRVGNRVGVLSSNGLVGLGLVVFFLFLFLPGKVGLMAAVSLPLAVMITIGYISSSGLTLNTITILALVISLGMLVDNAVVISENFARLRKEGMNSKDAVKKSIADLWMPITATAMTTIAAFLPMLVTKGIIGQFIKGIPIVVTAALLVSLAESFFLLPVRLITGKDKTMSDEEKTKKDWFEKYLLPPFYSSIRWLVSRRYIALGIFSGLIFGSIFMMAVVNKFILFPADQTEIYLSRLEMPRGTLIETTEKKMEELSKRVRGVLGDQAAYVTAKVGLSEMDFGDPRSRRGENVGMLFIFMTKEAQDSLITNEVLARLREIKLEGATDLSFEAAINGPPVGAPVTASFRSNSVQDLDAVTAVVMNALKATEGVFDVRVDDVYGSDEVFVELDQDKAARLGLDLAMVGSTVRMAMAGDIIADVNLDNREVNYFVRLEDEDRLNKNQLSNVKIMDSQGNLIALSQVANLVTKEGSPQIKRFDFKRAKTVTANINDDIITSVVANQIVADSFAKVSDQYKSVNLKFGGEAERTQESMESLFQALILSLIGIFALLVLLFKSYVRPVIILTTIPLGLIGVAIAFFLHGRPISFLALIGVVGLGGIIVNSGIVLISFIEQLRGDGPDRPLNDVLIEASSLRLKAVIMTTLTTVCGLVPTAYGIGGSDEFIIPMTLALAWGLMSGSVLTLFWVPCAYAITEDLAHLKERFFSGRLTRKGSMLSLKKREVYDRL